eukprot:642976-Pelagomonas_calceolata.AAC.3
MAVAMAVGSPAGVGGGRASLDCNFLAPSGTCLVLGLVHAEILNGRGLQVMHVLEGSRVYSSHVAALDELHCMNA